MHDDPTQNVRKRIYWPRHESRPERGGALPGRPVPRAGRRRQRQDARDHAEDRLLAARVRLHGPQRGGADLHHPGRARDGRAREDPGGPQAVQGPDHQHVPFAGREDAARRGAQRGPETHVLDPGRR
ncbi:hypothetical protein G6F31_018919 [Rhizopus arrhizus]|nr:hypothetical protein G6F31_018919 [Rhizopus arrhizus]